MFCFGIQYFPHTSIRHISYLSGFILNSFQSNFNTAGSSATTKARNRTQTKAGLRANPGVLLAGTLASNPVL